MKSRTALLILTMSLILLSVFPVTAYAQDEGGWTYEVDGKGKATITMYSGAGGTVAVPEKLGGHAVAAIGSDAFTTVEITSLKIPKGVASIDSGAFWECRALMSIDIEEGNPNYISSDGIVFSMDGATLFHYPAAKAGTSYTVPENVTSIGRCAFDHNMNLKSIVLSDAVTEIGESAFWRCQSLCDIAIPKSVTALGEGAFVNCSSLKEIAVDTGNSLFKTVDGVLFNAEGTTLLQCPAGKAGSYTVPDPVTAIGPQSFRGCTQLTAVTLSDSVTEMGSAAFAYCEGLIDVSLGGVKKIGGMAFQACFALTGMNIPASVTKIEGMAFDSCENLKALYFMGDPPAIADNSFQNTAADLSIYYHHGAKDGWIGFSGYNAAPFCVVSFDSAGGGAVPEQLVGIGGKAESPAAPENPGFALIGWYKDAEYSAAWDFAADTAAQDITLYAKWAALLKLSSSDDDGNIAVGESVTLTPGIDGGRWNYDNELLSLSGNTFTALKTGKATVTYSAEGQTAEYIIIVEEAAPVSADNAISLVPADAPAPAEQGFPWIIVIASLGALLLAGVIFAVMRKYKRGGNDGN